MRFAFVVIHNPLYLPLGEAWQVTLPDILLEELRALLGADKVRIMYTE